MPHRNRRTIAVLGVPFDNVTMHEAVELIERKIDEQGFHQVATANVDFLMHAMHDKSVQEMLCACDLIVPDGMPIVWASRLMGANLKERVSGVDLVPRLAELCARRDYGMYLLGGSERSSRRAAEALVQRYPSLRIDRYSPPLTSLEDMDHEEILARIEKAKPEILLVAMGHPKQERWISMHRDRLKVPLCMGVGASLDFLAGTVSRAPVWMQETGLEWLFRAYQEPKRLGRRYLNDAYALARHLPKQVAAAAIQPRKPANSNIQSTEVGNASIISISGDLTGVLRVQLDKLLLHAFQEDRHIVLDLAKIAYIDPESLGSFLRLTNLMKRRKRQLWFVGMPAHLRRLILAARVKHYFLTTTTVSDAVHRVSKGDSRLPMELVAMRSLAPITQDVDVQVEVLKGLCERIIAVGQEAQFSYGGLSTRTPVAQ